VEHWRVAVVVEVRDPLGDAGGDVVPGHPV
jgi:hypothetical protein